MSTSATVVTEKLSPVTTTTNATKTVVTEKNNTVVVDNKQPTIVLTGLMGPAGVTTMQGLTNVDVSTLITGSILVYNSTSQKWVATTTLEAQNMEGGYY